MPLAELPRGCVPCGIGHALIALLAFGDELGRDALGAFACTVAGGHSTRCRLLLRGRVSACCPASTRPEAFFKPDFSPLLLLSMNYIGRPLVLRPALLAATGATARSFTSEGFHDLALRCTEAAAEIHHVPELLSRTDGGTVVNPDDGNTAACCWSKRMARRGSPPMVLPESNAPEYMADVRRTDAQVKGKVSIIIPTCAAKGYIETCLTTRCAR